MIPNHFHFIYGLKEQNSPFHLMYYLCLKTCIEINSPEKIYFYYEHEPFGVYWELIKPELTLEKVSRNQFVDNFKYRKIGRKDLSYAHHADFIRLEKLLKKGGVYADMDTLFVKKLPSYLFDKPFVLGREPDIYSESTGEKQRSLCNALIMAEPNAEFAQRWFDDMQNHFDGSWSNHSTVLPQKLSEELPDEIHIEPQTSFYHFEWTKSNLKDLFERDVGELPGVYSIHLWKHLWFSSWKNDFSSFNGKRLDEEYVRSGSTTYARLAKPFLPSEMELKAVGKVPIGKIIYKKTKESVENIRLIFTRVAAKIQYLLKS
ncbi:MAG: glycosyltransferase [Balneolaceae bacterium]|nr:glycosyltransferase [Balneolaceae bacterium]